MKLIRVNLIVIGVGIGVIIGLALGWIVYPRQSRMATPKDLHSDYQDTYVVMVAAAHSGDGDLERARLRLSELGLTNVIDSVTSQAQRWAASGKSDFDVSVLGGLSLALSGESLEPEPVLAAMLTSSVVPTVNSTVTPYPTIVSATPVPTIVSVNEYTLLESTIICDEQLYQPLMKVYVTDAVGNPIAGVQLRIDWTTGSDVFATGLHPDIGYGYADFVIDPQQVYTLQVGSSTNPIYGISSEPCRIGNSTEFDGSVLIKWQREG